MTTTLERLQIDIPGIDDCDHLYTVTSLDELTSWYLRVERHGPTGLYYAAGTWDDDRSHHCTDLDVVQGPFTHPDLALRANMDLIREAFHANHIAYECCSNTRRALRRQPWTCIRCRKEFVGQKRMTITRGSEYACRDCGWTLRTKYC